MTEAAPPTPSSVPSFSPAKSATSVEVPPPSSPASNPSPEYTGLSTTGKQRVFKVLGGEKILKARNFWKTVFLKRQREIPRLGNLLGFVGFLQASNYSLVHLPYVAAFSWQIKHMINLYSPK